MHYKFLLQNGGHFFFVNDTISYSVSVDKKYTVELPNSTAYYNAILHATLLRQVRYTLYDSD